MKKQTPPAGWTQERLRKLAASHDRQTVVEQAAEINAAMARKGQTLLVVPTKLVPKILLLISPKRTA